MHVYVSAITTVQVPPARIDPRRARNHPRGTDLVRVVPPTDTDTIHDGRKATRARTLARLDDVFLLDFNVYLKKCIYVHAYIIINNVYCNRVIAANLIQLLSSRNTKNLLFNISRCLCVFAVYFLHLLYTHVSLRFPLLIRPMMSFFEVAYYLWFIHISLFTKFPIPEFLSTMYICVCVCVCVFQNLKRWMSDKKWIMYIFNFLYNM